jgi:hypothetical protein
MSEAKPKSGETPFDKFKKLIEKVVSVPRTEIQKREVEYKEQRKIKNHHRHR